MSSQAAETSRNKPQKRWRRFLNDWLWWVLDFSGSVLLKWILGRSARQVPPRRGLAGSAPERDWHRPERGNPEPRGGDAPLPPSLRKLKQPSAVTRWQDGPPLGLTRGVWGVYQLLCRCPPLHYFICWWVLRMVAGRGVLKFFRQSKFSDDAHANVGFPPDAPTESVAEQAARWTVAPLVW